MDTSLKNFIITLENLEYYETAYNLLKYETWI